MENPKNNLFLDQDDLSNGFENYKNYIQSDFDRLTIIINLIMNHSGFKFEQTEGGINLTKGTFFNKLTFNKFEDSSKSFHLENNLIITLINSGSKTIDISLKYSGFNSSFMTVILTDFFSSSLNAKIIELTNMFKNKVLNPFKVSYKKEKLINGMSDLPVEILFKIALDYLDIKGLVSLMQTSKFFLQIFDSDRTSCSSIWYGLFRRDWDKYGSLRREWVEASSINFRNDYIKNYKTKKRNTDPFLQRTTPIYQFY